MNHSVDPRSGRPEPANAWPALAVLGWILWAAAIALCVLGIYAYAKHGSIAVSLPIASPAIIFAAAGSLIFWTLRRKKAQFHRAMSAYEESFRQSHIED